MDMKTFGLKIKAARNEHGFTSDQLAELCDLSPSYIRQLEIGKKCVSLESLVQLCNTLHVSPETLLEEHLTWTKERALEGIAEKAQRLSAPQIHLIEVMIDTMLADNA